MIPLKDENPSRSYPLLTVSLIVANVGVFLAMPLQGSYDPNYFFTTYGLVPVRLLESPVTSYPTIFSAMFIHNGFFHLAGNMLFLWIFGDNVEDVLGKIKFLIFYLACGVAAAFCHILSDADSAIPMVGASGAISGVLGAYLVLFPYARIRTLIFLGFFITIVRIPALVLLGIWLLIQVSSSFVGGGESGIAWTAHIGGFMAGAILIHPFRSLS